MGLSAPRTCRSVSLAGGALVLRLPALTCRVNPGEFACALSPAGDAHSPRGQPTGAPLSCVCHSGRRLRVGDRSLAGTAPGTTRTPHATGPLRGRAEGSACGLLAGLRSQVSRERHPKAVGRERAGEQPLLLRRQTRQISCLRPCPQRRRSVPQTPTPRSHSLDERANGLRLRPPFPASFFPSGHNCRPPPFTLEQTCQHGLDAEESEVRRTRCPRRWPCGTGAAPPEHAATLPSGGQNGRPSRREDFSLF